MLCSFWLGRNVENVHDDRNRQLVYGYLLAGGKCFISSSHFLFLPKNLRVFH